jgi:DNA-binding NarL/FixJ family response regulator
LRGAYEQAAELFRESLALLRELGDKPCSANAFEQMGHLALAHGRARRAARLFAAASGLDQASGRGAIPARRAAVERALAAARAALEEAGFAEAWSEGQEMEYHQAVEYALGGLTRDPVAAATPKQAPLAGRADPLTAREREVAALIARGLMNRQIGAELVITERTVETHVANILSKLGLTSRTQIATWAVAQGLLAAGPR